MVVDEGLLVVGSFLLTQHTCIQIDVGLRVETFLLEKFILLLRLLDPSFPRLCVLLHTVEELAQVVVLVQVARIAGEVAQALSVAQSLTEDLPGERVHSEVDQFERDQEGASGDLLG